MSYITIYPNGGDAVTAPFESLSQIEAHGVVTLDPPDENGIESIPYHAIDFVKITRKFTQSTPSDTNCGGSYPCSYDAIQVWPEHWEHPFEWLSEGLVIGGSPYQASTWVSFQADDEKLHNFTAESADTSVVTVDIRDNEYDTTMLYINAVDITTDAETTVTVSFPDYSCAVTLMVEVRSEG